MNKKSLQKFGKLLKDYRNKKELSLREVCKLVSYDPSNWSKIERGLMSAPIDDKVLSLWAKTLGLVKKSDDYNNFIDEAHISQGIIPADISANDNIVEYLPAFFRTLRNKKPTKKEIDDLIKLIKDN